MVVSRQAVEAAEESGDIFAASGRNARDRLLIGGRRPAAHEDRSLAGQVGHDLVRVYDSAEADQAHHDDEEYGQEDREFGQHDASLAIPLTFSGSESSHVATASSAGLSLHAGMNSSFLNLVVYENSQRPPSKTDTRPGVIGLTP
jgi:hypothetical protein